MSRAARRAVIKEGLKTLKMPSVLRDYEQKARQAQDAQWDYEDYLWQLLETEIRDREARTVERRLRAARFPDHKTLEQIDFEALQGVSKPKLRELASCDYIDRGDDVVLVGPIGTGKTHLAIALGIEAAKRRYRVWFRKASDLVRDLLEARDQREFGPPPAETPQGRSPDLRRARLRALRPSRRRATLQRLCRPLRAPLHHRHLQPRLLRVGPCLRR